MALTLGERILREMTRIGARIDALNIVVLEDSDADGKPIATQSLDDWNDRILVVKNTGEIAVNTSGTSEPGYWYTKNLMNPKGAARLALGQHKDAWAFGKHFQQNALVQIKPLPVHRDLNKDGFRTNDKVDIGMFGINFHTTGNAAGQAPAKIGKWSAGCVVTRNSTIFYNAIMPLLRYSGRKTFSLTIIDAANLWTDYPAKVSDYPK